MSAVEEFIRQNLIYIYLAWFFAIFLYVFYSFMKNRGKIKVNVRTSIGETSFWKKPEVDGKTIIMNKASKKKRGWSFEFSRASLTPISWFFGLRHGHEVDVWYDDPRAINWIDDRPEEVKPKLTGKMAGELNKLDGFKRRYGKVEQPKSGLAIWLVLLVSIFTLILLILQMRGVSIV